MIVWCTRTHGNGQRHVANVEMDTWNHRHRAVPFPDLAKAFFDGDDERDFCGV